MNAQPTERDRERARELRQKLLSEHAHASFKRRFDEEIAQALAADYLRLREDIAAAETSAIMWKASCEQAEAQLAKARRALETKGLADAYRDGFDAALHTADSFKSVVVWGPSASPADAYNAGIQHLREVLHKARAALPQEPASDGPDTDYDPSRDM